MTSDLKAYSTGYMKPPKQHQFKKGKSGNPKGRPKQIEDPFLVLQRVLKRKVHVKGGGKKILIEEALIRRLRELALSGDRRAVQMQQRIIEMTHDTDAPDQLDVDVLAAKERFMEMYALSSKGECNDGGQDDQ